MADNKAVLSASHNGYRKMYGGPVHQRNMQLGKSSLHISDVLDGDFTQAIARFYLHPDLAVTLTNGTLRVVGKHFKMTADLSEHQALLSQSEWHPSFGLSLQNQCLEIPFSQSESHIEFTWIAK